MNTLGVEGRDSSLGDVEAGAPPHVHEEPGRGGLKLVPWRDDDDIILAVNAPTLTVIVKDDFIFDQLAVTQVHLFNKVFDGVSNVCEGILPAFLSY
ncbi:Bifunctional glutamine synthetase adenylyltransferase/adenylyl-removing enzyme [Frankliniella fusca]|uniref:Bifunctional glutamine synthetase adenylyltransferase/adenylyl-removing enzyme n=1 Tax=Frankliniella fusca TaxID=407009 RepID=A0AAE1GY37_9NEOP|nr:Bifunctional glutamine synthetase adenylyltransferase/adenylyl-removing enzyme [Frankliniella fusca]